MAKLPTHNVSREQCREIAQMITSANGHRAKVIEQIADARGCSTQFVYELAKRGGWTSGRKIRIDSGCAKPAPATEDEFRQIAKIKMLSTTMKYIQPMSSETALDIAEESGIIERGSVSPDHLNKWMRAKRVHRDAAKRKLPRKRYKTPYPNYEHQLDTSACQLWYLDDDDALKENYRGRQDPAKKPKGVRLIRYTIVDHHSGWYYIQYYADFENWITGAMHCFEAWTRKRDETKWPCCGVPEHLYVDAGSFRSKHMRRLCEELGTELEVGPGSGTMTKGGKEASADARGLVEGHHWIFEREFETRLWLEKPTTLAELQEKAYQMCIFLNGMKEHRRHGLTRTQKFQEIPSDKLRIPPPDFQAFMSLADEPKLCKIQSDMTIRFKGNGYEVLGIPVDLTDSWVEVKWSPYSYPLLKIRGEDGNYYEARPLAEDSNGWYENAVSREDHPEAFEDTSYERWKKHIMKADLPELRALPNFEERLKNLRFMPKHGTEISLESAPTNMSMYDALGLIRDEIGRDITVAENEALRGKYGDWMSAAEVQAESESLRVASRESMTNTGTTDSHR